MTEKAVKNCNNYEEIITVVSTKETGGISS